MTIMEPNAAAEAAPDGLVDLDAATPIPGQRGDVTSADPSGAGPSAAATDERGDDLLVREAGQTPVPPAQPTATVAPAILLVRRASGTYRSQGTGFQLELRVDVDGVRPLRRLSGDYYAVSGATTTYFGSWTVDAVTVSTTPSTVTVVGTARTTWATTFTVARVTIPRTSLVKPAAPATVQWSTHSGATGSSYTCAWQSGSFRTVELEQDCERGVAAFESYDTGSLPSGGAARTLTVAGAYGEAGVRILDTGRANVITTPAGHLWTNASLHNAMLNHFSRAQEVPQFKVWLLHARAHEFGTGLRGIMFDQQGLQRQGCASFYQAISTPTHANRREQLYVNVHELGHCFNLFHSFHKTSMNPPLPNRPGSLSWMNYPRNFDPGNGAPSGAAAFWSAFPFQFDDLELAHVRHGFRNAVIMGGNPFGGGAAFDAGQDYSDPVADRTGMSLRIAASPARPVLGEPVVLEISLSAEPGTLMHAREQLHPKYGIVSVAVRRPRGDVVVHRPPLEHCAEPELLTAGRGETQPISAYIGYDAVVGQLFEDPGTYVVRALYAAPDGSIVASNVASLRVAAPHSDAEDRLAELALQDETGMVLTLMGSDSAHLSSGTQALQTVLDEFSDSPLAVYARLTEGMNAARPFTEVHPDGSVDVRGRDLDRADSLLGEAVDASRGESGLDDLTVLQVLSYLAGAHEDEGDSETASGLLDDARQLARQKDAPAAVLSSLGE